MKHSFSELSLRTGSAMTVLALGVFLTLVRSDLFAQWQPDVRLTNDPANSDIRYTNGWRVAASGNVVHVVWQDDRDGNKEIYYKRSADGGSSWSIDTRLTNDTAVSQYPSIAASGAVVHVVWSDGNDEIYYKRSADGGSSWGADVRLTIPSIFSLSPSIAVSGSVVHVVWYDARDGNNEIYYKRSTDGGSSWGADTRLTDNSGISWYPSVSVADSVVHIVWQDTRDGNWEIYYKRNPAGNIVGIEDINSEIPVEFSLGQNYPNPFNPTTNFQFSIANSQLTILKVYNVLGKEVVTLVNEVKQPGTYTVRFDGSDLPSSVYFYQLRAGAFIQTKKMILMR